MPIARHGLTGSKSDIGTSPARLISDRKVVVNAGVQLVASSDNSEIIWVGYNDDITAGTADATDGFPLAAGAGMFMPVRHPADIWVRSTSGESQKVHYLGQ